MSPLQRYALVWFVLAALAAWLLRFENEQTIQGKVTDAGPVAQAVVRCQGQHRHTVTDEQGRFRLRLSHASRRITASKPGYRVASAPLAAKFLSLRLLPLPSEDNPNYEWIDPRPDPSQTNNCANCHQEIYREWATSAHALSVTNPKFLHLFAGTDGKSRKHPTWNAQAEHPLGAAVCATCHVPTLRSKTLDYDVREAEGVVRSGIHCDYCHKVADAPTDKLGTRFGRDGLHLLRPANDDMLSFGPLDDAVRAGESFGHLPLYKESRYCAPCHEGIVFGVHAYGTYSEWLDSPARKQGRQCQDCHMTPTGRMTNIARGKGGIERNPFTLASHHMPGGQRDMLQRCLKMQVRTSSNVEGKQVDVELVADHVGHRVPTGFVDRHVMLVVEAADERGASVRLLHGSRLPMSAGKWAGFAGMLYAKQLFGEQDRTPVPFWLPIFKTHDTRLVPQQPDRRTFVFAGSARRATVRLWYRRFWQEVADARGFTDNDVLIAEQGIGW